jgi:hypothetical protein
VYYLKKTMAKQPLIILKINRKWFISGVILLLLGYIILQINRPETNWESAVFAWYKLILAPIILISGYFFIGLSLFIPSKK